MINLLNENRESNFLIICDHASKFIPREYKNLGLDESVLDTHIAYDIGAKEVAIRASNSLQCPLVMSNFSRLLIDPNRGVDDPTLIMKVSDGSIIQGNKKISYLSDCGDKANRISSFYDVYHNKISELINKSIERGVFPAIISVHSFTPFWKDRKRLVELGILWDSDNRLSDIFFNYFMKHHSQLAIGNNKPYSGKMKNDTLYRHATKRGLANVLIEIRQDLILSNQGQKYFAKLITDPLIESNNNYKLFQRKVYKSLAV